MATIIEPSVVDIMQYAPCWPKREKNFCTVIKGDGKDIRAGVIELCETDDQAIAAADYTNTFISRYQSLNQSALRRIPCEITAVVPGVGLLLRYV